MKRAYLFVYGKRLLTEVHAHSEEEARASALSEFAVNTFCDRGNGESPSEYRSYLQRAEIKSVPLPADYT